MLKKVVIFINILVLFCITNNIYAYEFKYPEHENEVNEMVENIFNDVEMYEELAGEYLKDVSEIYDASSNSYWWPIGSSETTEVNGVLFANGEPETKAISSYYGIREDPFGGDSSSDHRGLDITGGSGLGNTNIIAVQGGVVVYPTKDSNVACPSSNENSDCGGGYGNHVIIQHSDGNYTLYGHLYEGSISVQAGDRVEQGQVIAKMGSSGSSTGAHLHFEVREGINSMDYAVDPLNYISSEQPRRSSSANTDFLEFLQSWEGKGKVSGTSYVVEDLKDGELTVGSGVTLRNNVECFAKYGIDVTKYKEGDLIPIEIVDKVMLDIINDKSSNIELYLSNNSIVLKQHQIYGLVSRTYNIGNYNGFAEAYKKYGDTDDLYTNWFFNKSINSSKFKEGLTKRRNAEWSLFHDNEYVLNN